MYYNSCVSYVQLHLLGQCVQSLHLFGIRFLGNLPRAIPPPPFRATKNGSFAADFHAVKVSLLPTYPGERLVYTGSSRADDICHTLPMWIRRRILKGPEACKLLPVTFSSLAFIPGSENPVIFQESKDSTENSPQDLPYTRKSTLFFF